MSKDVVSVSLDAELIAHARTRGELAAVIEDALRRRLYGMTNAGRWAEENALLVEAYAGEAEEAQA